MSDEKELTALEKRAIAALQKLAKTWPQTLVVFCSGSMDVRKPGSDGRYGYDTVVAFIDGIRNDGGDGADVFYD